MDVLQWLKYTLIPFGINSERNIIFEHFHNTDGLALSSMTLSDFVTCSSTFGSFLYDKLQTYLRAENSVSNLYQRKFPSILLFFATYIYVHLITNYLNEKIISLHCSFTCSIRL